MAEFMILGLRMTAGIDPAEFNRRFGISLDEKYGDIVKKHIGWGTLEKAEGRIRLTEYGLDVSNMVFEEFI